MSKVHITIYLITIFLVFGIGCQSYFPTPQQPVTIDWVDGDIIFVSNRATPERTNKGWDGPLYFLDVEDKRSRPVQNSKQFTFGIAPVWSPDGMMLAFIHHLRELKGHRGTLILDVTGQRKLLDTDQQRFATTWSPDGQYFAYYTKPPNHMLTISHLDGSNEVNLVSSLSDDLFEDPYLIKDVRISWSPDGRFLAYDDIAEDGRRYIWLVSIDGQVVRQFVAGSHPAWSPLGNEIAFDRNGDIWIANVDSNTKTILFEQPIRHLLCCIGWPTWSPDGQQLAFVTDRDGNAEIYRINRDGSGLENLTNHPADDAFPAWRPN